jgi:hypothetical protein
MQSGPSKEEILTPASQQCLELIKRDFDDVYAALGGTERAYPSLPDVREYLVALGVEAPTEPELLCPTLLQALRESAREQRRLMESLEAEEEEMIRRAMIQSQAMVPKPSGRISSTTAPKTVTVRTIEEVREPPSKAITARGTLPPAPPRVSAPRTTVPRTSVPSISMSLPSVTPRPSIQSAPTVSPYTLAPSVPPKPPTFPRPFPQTSRLSLPQLSPTPTKSRILPPVGLTQEIPSVSTVAARKRSRSPERPGEERIKMPRRPPGMNLREICAKTTHSVEEVAYLYQLASAILQEPVPGDTEIPTLCEIIMTVMEEQPSLIETPSSPSRETPYQSFGRGSLGLE